jgi:hypothetical protein
MILVAVKRVPVLLPKAKKCLKEAARLSTNSLSSRGFWNKRCNLNSDLDSTRSFKGNVF